MEEKLTAWTCIASFKASPTSTPGNAQHDTKRISKRFEIGDLNSTIWRFAILPLFAFLLSFRLSFSLSRSQVSMAAPAELDVNVLIIGAGPTGLGAAIPLHKELEWTNDQI